MEAIKEYLRYLREATLGKDGGDKGKAPMQQELSPSYSTPGIEPSIPPPERTEEVEEGGKGAHREPKRLAVPSTKLVVIRWRGDIGLVGEGGTVFSSQPPNRKRKANDSGSLYGRGRTPLVTMEGETTVI